MSHKTSGLILHRDAESAERRNRMDYEEIKRGVYHDFYKWPFYHFAREIIDPMVKKIHLADFHGMVFPKEYPAPITWSDANSIKTAWANAMERECEIRPILEECRELMG